MITLFGGLLLAIVVYSFCNKYVLKEIIGLTCTLVILLATLAISLFIPVEGYNAPVLVKQVELLPYYGDSEIYVVEISGDEYLYLYKEKSWTNGSVIERVKGNVDIDESESYTSPVLKIYRVEAKRSLFTFAAFSDRIEQVFCIPPGTSKKLYNK